MAYSADDAIRAYNEAKTLRQPFEVDWKRSVAYCQPYAYAAWMTEGPPVEGQGGRADIRRLVYDNTGVNALPKYAAIIQRLMTPDGQRWLRLTASNTRLMQVYAVRDYFDQLTDLLFKYRYNPAARFTQSVGESYTSIGVVGTGPLRVAWRKPKPGQRKGGFGYKSVNLRDVFVLLDDDDNVHTTFVRFYLTAPQFKLKWPDETPPRTIAAELQKAQPSHTTHYEFVHIVYPRTAAEYDPHALDHRRFTHFSQYLCVNDKEFVGKNGGYNGNPYLTPRAVTSGGAYGVSPAMLALTALGGASAVKKSLLKAGQKAVDPVILASDDGVLSGKVDLRPGRVNYGGVDSQGRMLVRALEMGNFQVGEVTLQDERKDINDSFFVTLFQILEDHPEMTATEVVERLSKEVALLAPTMGRMQAEFLGPDVQREIAMLAENAPYEMPEMPAELIEAQGEYDVIYTSPAAKNLYAEEDAGFMRVAEMALNYAQATGDPSPLDHLNFDAAIPEIADHRSVPTRWTNDEGKIADIRGKREQAAQADKLIQAGPAIASVATAAMKNKTGSQKGVTQ